MKLLSFFFLAITCVPSWAEPQIIFSNKATEDTLLPDKNTIRRDKETATMWILSKYPRPQTDDWWGVFDQAYVLVQYDCKALKSAFLEAKFKKKDGSLVFSTQAGVLRWRTQQLGSTGYKHLAIACNIK